jgi:hypothetical protein
MEKITLYILLILISGCSLKEREETIRKKEKELAEKEKELISRENTIALKEAEIAENKESLIKPDIESARIDSSLTGVWNVKMVCTETTCPGSAIGDTKTEKWHFSYYKNLLVVRAMANNNLIRVYTGSVENNQIKLIENVNIPSSNSTVQIVRLSERDHNSIKGQRTIIRDDDCTIIYKLDLKNN